MEKSSAKVKEKTYFISILIMKPCTMQMHIKIRSNNKSTSRLLQCNNKTRFLSRKIVRCAGHNDRKRKGTGS